MLGNLAAWLNGASIVYPSPTFNPEAIVNAVAQERCTALHGVPTHFLQVLSEVQKRHEAGEKVDLGCLRWVFWASVGNFPNCAVERGLLQDHLYLST